MRAGDLIRMKFRTFWDLKRNSRMNYTEEPLLVLEVPEHGAGAVKVLYPDGQIKSGIKEWYEVISES